MTSRVFIKNDKREMVLELKYADHNGERSPTAACDGLDYRSVASLVSAHPELCTAQRLPLCCELILHFQEYTGFLSIADPEEYRTRYAALLQYAETDGEFATAGDFDHFDVSEIVLPRTVDGKLVFYAEDYRYHLPYRMEAPWPLRENLRVDRLLLSLPE